MTYSHVHFEPNDIVAYIIFVNFFLSLHVPLRQLISPLFLISNSYMYCGNIYFFHLYFVDVERTALEKLPGLFDTYSIGVFRHPIVHLRNIPGFQNGAFNKYLHNHTLYLTNVLKQIDL